MERGRIRLTIVGVLVGMVCACSASRTSSRNLDALISSNDRFRYRATVSAGATATTWLGRAIPEFVSGFKEFFSGAPKDPKVRNVRNPTRVALSNLRRLARSSDGPRVWRWNEQVRHLTRYARHSHSQLCRERAVLELADHGLRLGVPAEFTPPDEDVANAPELIEAIDGLVDAMTRVAKEGETPTARADFGAAVAVLRGIQVDIQGGSRLLRAIGPFLRLSRVRGEMREALEALAIDVQTRLVGEALWAARRDRSEVVRAAGFRAAYEVHGEEFLIEALIAMLPRRWAPEDIAAKYGRFDVPFVPPTFDAVHVAIGDMLAENGLPLAARLPNAESVRLRMIIFRLLVEVAVNDVAFTGAARHAIMRALGSVSGGDLRSIRSEDWEQWWGRVAPALEAEIESLEASSSS